MKWLSTRVVLAVLIGVVTAVTCGSLRHFAAGYVLQWLPLFVAKAVT